MSSSSHVFASFRPPVPPGGDSDIVKAERKKEKRRALVKIPRQPEASFLIFLTLGSIKRSNTHTWM